jgi:hypothetical protein
MRANTSVVIPQHIREALDKSPNASAHNNIIVCKLNEKLYAARWNLQPHEMELDQLWETTTNEPCNLNPVT